MPVSDKEQTIQSLQILSFYSIDLIIILIWYKDARKISIGFV